MRRTILAAVALCCFATTVHATQGMNLRWDACLGDGGRTNKSFACDTNSGSEYLYVSFVTEQPIADITGVEVSVHVHAVAATMPSWWSVFGPLSCRPTALRLYWEEGAQTANCQNVFGSDAGGGVTEYTEPFAGTANYKQILFVIGSSSPFTALPGTEYFAGQLGILHLKTTSESSCAGCSEPVCIGLNTITLTHASPTTSTHLTDESFPGSSYISWQGGVPSRDAEPVSNHNQNSYRTIGCSLPVPARNHTWGSIKSLYH